MPSPSPQNTPADVNTSSEAPKARRFAPEPIETTSKSSKARKHSPEKEETPKVRRFAPEPVETTTKSSRDKGTESQESNKPAARRFAPQPIETTAKSSRNKKQEDLKDEVKPAPRRFAPEPIKTTHKSSKDGSGHIRFKPQLVETVYSGNRRSSSRRTSQDSNASNVASESNAPRKFKPTVISTAKRSRRAGDSNADNYQDYKTEEGHVIHAREHQRHAGWKTPQENASLTGEKSHGFSHADLEEHPEMRRHLAPMDGRAPERQSLLKQERKHSFRCPELDTIESSESERESGQSSMSCSPGQGSPITASDSSFTDYYKHATRIRESVDENFSQYFLKLEAKKAEKRMQEQALAAFPNSDFHEPVQHYVNSEQDSSSDMEIEDRPVTWEGFDEEEFMHRAAIRRESTGKINWEQLEMQRHAELVEQERKANKTTEKRNEPSSPWWKPDAAPSIHQQDSEMRSMRDRARPPMLGRDIMFPRCPSPEPARFDVTQSCATLRKQMCNQSEIDTQKTAGGLWGAPAPKSDQSVSSAAAKSPAKSVAAKGLWGGFCVTNNDSPTPGLAPPSIPTGLMTPAPRGDNINPFEQSFAGRAVGNVTLAPPTPPESVDMNRLDAMLISEQKLEEDLEKEFPESFITQVYNYLSLGYPSLAKPFDEELSKISGIPIKELREDDVKAKQTPRGYIRLGPDFEGGGGDGMTAVECKRWQALKLYVREWARQERKVDAPAGGGWQLDANGGNWATTQRRGSWAI